MYTCQKFITQESRGTLKYLLERPYKFFLSTMYMYQIREPRRHPKIWYVHKGDERLNNFHLLNIYQVWEFSVHLKHRT